MADVKACAGRVERLRALMAERGYDAVILRNNPDLRWLTGCERTFDDEVAHTAVITPTRQLLHTDSRYYNTFCERLGANTAWELDETITGAEQWAADRIREAHARVVAIEDTCTLDFYDALKVALSQRSVACLLPRLHGDLVRLRAVKDSEEIELMRAAQRITDEAFRHICGYIKPGVTEQQIRAELENYMTRTVCVGEPSDEQRHVYDVVRQAHEECAAMARAGVIGKDVYDHSVKVISDAGYGDFYKHGLGHGVGVEIHEEPNFNRRNMEPIPAGAVITIEPGIYLPGKFGIRLEDFGLVTEDGYEPFTESPHELTVIPC